MLARHAENLFWAGRYIERAELTARMVDVTYHGLLESPAIEVRETWAQLLDVLQLASTYAERHGEVDPARAIEFLVDDVTNGGSVRASITRARDNLRGVRELVSSETWEAINSLYLQISQRDVHADLAGQPYELFGEVKRGAQLVVGVANDTMPHDDGWRFLTLGRMLERVEMTCRLLLVRLGRNGQVHEELGFADGLAILKSVSASEAFRKTHQQMDPAGVIDFLVFSSAFPRAVLYCLQSADHQLAVLGDGTPGVGRARRRLGRMRAGVEFRNVEELLAEGLGPFFDGIQNQIREVADCVGDEFFRHTQPMILHNVTAT